MYAMPLYILLGYMYWLSSIVTADRPLENLLLLRGPCFEVVETPASSSCNTTLAEGFETVIPNIGFVGPTTQVFLFTPRNPDAAEQLHLCGGKLPPDTAYDSEADTEVFIHGWLDGVCRSAWMREMKEQLFVRGDYNVILVDWGWGNGPEFGVAGTVSSIVGDQLAFVINNIMEQTGVGPEKFHLVGPDLGAIASGYTGRNVGGIRRITALDPSYVPYGVPPLAKRVTYKDAEVVDVIHTSSPPVPTTVGHADFYPNGGPVQPSCYPFILISFLKGDIFSGLISLVDRSRRFCFHLQSIQYYKASVNPGDCLFYSVSIPTPTPNTTSPNSDPILDVLCAGVMGMDYEQYRSGDSTERKQYYLITLPICPYCVPNLCQVQL